MAVKLRDRALVSEGFQQAIRKLYQDYLKNEASKLHYMSELSRRRYLSEHGGVIARIRRVLSSPEQFDLEVTRLRGLPYSAYALVRYPNHEGQMTVYFQGTTRDICVTDESRDVTQRKWNLGPYDVYIPLSIFTGGSIEGMHFVPKRAPMTEARHPHHKSYNRREGARFPTEREPSTCWGSFAALATLCGRDCDLPEMYRILAVYLGRYDHNSPLVWRGIGAIAHKEAVQ